MKTIRITLTKEDAQAVCTLNPLCDPSDKSD